MEATKCESNGQCLFHLKINVKQSNGEDERRSRNYKPNIWSYDYLESLVSHKKVSLCGAQIESLKEHFIYLFNQETDASKLHIIDNIDKLGLYNLFEKEIRETFDGIASGLKTNLGFMDNVGTAALLFRLLRQHGYNVSQGIFTDFLDKGGAVKNSRTPINIKGLIELYEASHLAVEGESLLMRTRAFSRENLKRIDYHSSDKSLTGQVHDAMELPLHWRVQWFEVRKRIDTYELDVTGNTTLLELAKLNFNVVQSMHQRDLRELSIWWRNLGLLENMSFARDRLAESFLWTVGVAPEPHYSNLRKCLTKVVTLILVIDDLYDIYGSLDELECFTRAVDRWSREEAYHLPECMKNCFRALYHTTNEIARDVQNETGCHSLLPYLRKAWSDFCKALLTEAKWYNKGYTPSLEEYLACAWISSSGPLLSLVIFLSARKELGEKLMDGWGKMQDLIYYSSVVIRLCNDLATTEAELERGDSPSSILCYMREANVTEAVARRRIKNIIACSWKRINGEYVKQFPMLLSPANLIINTTRVSHFIYQNGDGFGVQDGDTKKQIKRILVEPVMLD